MDPEAMCQCLSFGFSNKKSKFAIGKYMFRWKWFQDQLYEAWSRCDSFQSLLNWKVHYDFNFMTGTFDPLHSQSNKNPNSNLSVILKWSPYSTEGELLKQFEDVGSHGTKVIVYNLWLDEEGNMELDFDLDPEVLILFLIHFSHTYIQNTQYAFSSSSSFVKPVELISNWPPGFKEGSNLKLKLRDEPEAQMGSRVVNVSNMDDVGNNGGALSVIDENKKLKTQCLEFEKAEEELKHKVMWLKMQLGDAQTEYSRLLAELEDLEIVKGKTNQVCCLTRCFFWCKIMCFYISPVI